MIRFKIRAEQSAIKRQDVFASLSFFLFQKEKEHPKISNEKVNKKYKKTPFCVDLFAKKYCKSSYIVIYLKCKIIEKDRC